jgi:hypothetical protein
MQGWKRKARLWEPSGRATNNLQPASKVRRATRFPAGETSAELSPRRKSLMTGSPAAIGGDEPSRARTMTFDPLRYASREPSDDHRGHGPAPLPATFRSMLGATIAPVCVTPTTRSDRPVGDLVPYASMVPSGEKAGQTFQVFPAPLLATSLGLPPWRTRKISLPGE